MTAIQLMLENGEEMSLRKALRYSGMSSCSYYYKPVPRVIEPADPVIVQKVEEMIPTKDLRKFLSSLP